jgi:hypothetical protein
LSAGETAETVLGKVGNFRRIRINNCNVQHWYGKPMFYYRLFEGGYNDFNHFDFYFTYVHLNMNL